MKKKLIRWQCGYCGVGGACETFESAKKASDEHKCEKWTRWV